MTLTPLIFDAEAPARTCAQRLSRFVKAHPWYVVQHATLFYVEKPSQSLYGRVCAGFSQGVEL